MSLTHTSRNLAALAVTEYSCGTHRPIKSDKQYETNMYVRVGMYLGYTRVRSDDSIAQTRLQPVANEGRKVRVIFTIGKIIL